MNGKDMRKTQIADLKIGTSTVTRNCSENQAKLAKRKQKDSETTSVPFGYKFTGYEYKNIANGQVHSKFLKKPYLNQIETLTKLYSLFAYDIDLFVNQ